MKIHSTEIHQYRCWLCGKVLAINQPRYMRNGDTCHCEYPGGYVNPQGKWAEIAKDPEKLAELKRSLLDGHGPGVK